MFALRSFSIVLSLVVPVLALNSVAGAQCLDRWQPGVDGIGTSGSVSAMAVYDDGRGPAMYVGGSFSLAGSADAKYLARWDGTSWESVGTLDGTVYALRAHAGNLYAVGNFTHADGQVVNRVAVWNGHQWSGLGMGFSAAVYDIVFHNDEPIAAGDFTDSGGTPCAHVARWNGASWQAMGTGQSKVVRSLLDDAGTLYCCGDSPGRVSSWNGTQWVVLDPTFFAQSLSAWTIGITRFQGTLYVGSSAGVCRFDVPTAKWIATGSPSNNQNVYAASDGYLYAGCAGGPQVNKLARYNGSAWEDVPSLTADTEYVNTFAEFNGALYTAGKFQNLNGVACDNLACRGPGGWGPLVTHGWQDANVVRAVTSWRGNLYAGGQFHIMGDVLHNNISAWDGQQWNALGSGIPDHSNPSVVPVRCMLVDHDRLIVGGRFDSAGGVAAFNIASWDGAAWSPLGAGAGSTAYYPIALAAFQDRIVASLGRGVTRYDNGAWSNIAIIDLGSSVAALAPTQGTLYAGGSFSTINSIGGFANIGAWNGTAWSPVGTGTNGRVNALAWFNNELIAGGVFTTAGGVNTGVLARWNGSQWLALDPRLFTYKNGGDEVDALTVQGDRLLIGGRFWLEQPQCTLASWDGAVLTPVLPQPNGTVYAITDHEGYPAVGGTFTKVGTVSALDVSYQHCVCIADFNADGYVTGDDFDAFVINFELGFAAADIDQSTFVNGDDFDLFVEHFESGC